MGFSASACIHSIGVNQCVLTIKASNMDLHHFLYILLLQIHANCRGGNINIIENSIKVC
jgi:hypothetical protein